MITNTTNNNTTSNKCEGERLETSYSFRLQVFILFIKYIFEETSDQWIVDWSARSKSLWDKCIKMLSSEIKFWRNMKQQEMKKVTKIPTSQKWQTYAYSYDQNWQTKIVIVETRMHLKIAVERILFYLWNCQKFWKVHYPLTLWRPT